MESLKNLIPASKLPYSRLMCNKTVNLDTKRKRSLRQDVAKSKVGTFTWGPTHSQDSDDNEDSSVGPHTPVAASPPSPPNVICKKALKGGKTEHEHDAKKKGTGLSMLDGLWNCASETWTDYINPGCEPCNTCQGKENSNAKSRDTRTPTRSTSRHSSRITSPLSNTISLHRKSSGASSLTSGIARQDRVLGNENVKRASLSCNDENARAAARAMAAQSEDLWEPPPPPTTPSPATNQPNEKRDCKRNPPPVTKISFQNNNKFERSISELTMKSCLEEISEKISSSRRMAYYAVGKHSSKQKSNSGGGNRRCYFTGDLIRGGQPFYAGSVQQGMRTLVVFCLPKALGLPKKEELERLALMDQSMEIRTCASNLSQKSRKSHKSIGAKSQISRYSSVWSDGAAMESFVTEHWEEDDNGNLCETLNAEWLLQALPEPKVEIMQEMESRYPDQYETLPQQVRKHSCWRLYLKFCFFSGLPIADGEMYYKVSDKITAKLRKQLYRAGIDEIILSYEVMEAVHGQSSEIVNLPTKKTFRYLNQHYEQQCTKLNDKVFKRTSWEKVMPEV